MDPIDTLSTIAEVSITLAGFAAIATSLQTRSVDGLVAARIRLQVLLVNSFGILLLALFAVLLLHAGFDSGVVWRCTSVVFLLMMGGNHLWARRYLSMLDNEKFRLPRSFQHASLIFSLSAIAVNIINLVYWAAFWPLLYGITAALFTLSGSFTWLVVTYLESLIPEDSKEG